MNLPEKFCAAPFISATVGTNGKMIPCCKYSLPGVIPANQSIVWWESEMNNLRNKFISGENDSGCEQCIREEIYEDQIPLRVELNSHCDVTDVVEKYINHQRPKLLDLELRVSNYCKLKCIMCGEYASSEINTEYQNNKKKYNIVGIHMNDFRPVKWWEDDESVRQILSISSSVKRINVSGGEPLLVPRVWDIVAQIQEKTNCSIRFNTSFSIDNEKMLSMISKLKNLKFSVSLEGIREHNEYVRNGSNWNTILKNMIKFNFRGFSIIHVMQHTSVFTIPRLVEFCESMNLEIRFDTVSYNSYPGDGALTINSVHPRDFEIFENWLTTRTWKNEKYFSILRSWTNHYVYDPNLNAKFHEYVSMLDSIRGTSFDKTFKPTYENIK